MIEGVEQVRAVVWGFDGVLNRTPRPDAEGLVPWQHALEGEPGLDPHALARAIETHRVALWTGAADILDVIEGWAGRDADAEDVLELILEATHDPDPDLIRMTEALAEAGVVQLILLDTDARRARWLAQDQGWLGRVDAIFSSSETGFLMPDPALFKQIETVLGIPPHEILLIDSRTNAVAAVEKRGWLGWDHAPGGARALATALMPLMVRGAV